MKWITYYLIACVGAPAVAVHSYDLTWGQRILAALSWPMGWFYLIKDFFTDYKLRFLDRRWSKNR